MRAFNQLNSHAHIFYGQTHFSLANLAMEIVHSSTQILLQTPIQYHTFGIEIIKLEFVHFSYSK